MKAQMDVSNHKHAAKLKELSSSLKEKQELVQTLQTKLKESEVRLERLILEGLYDLRTVRTLACLCNGSNLLLTPRLCSCLGSCESKDVAQRC